MSLFDDEHRIRVKTFERLEKQTLLYGEVLPRTLLEKGFEFKRIRIPLLGAQGIWKPKP